MSEVIDFNDDGPIIKRGLVSKQVKDTFYLYHNKKYYIGGGVKTFYELFTKLFKTPSKGGFYLTEHPKYLAVNKLYDYIQEHPKLKNIFEEHKQKEGFHFFTSFKISLIEMEDFIDIIMEKIHLHPDGLEFVYYSPKYIRKSFFTSYNSLDQFNINIYNTFENDMEDDSNLQTIASKKVMSDILSTDIKEKLVDGYIIRLTDEQKDCIYNIVCRSLNENDDLILKL